jgi:uroporphyrin-III C-methyltransferase
MKAEYSSPPSSAADPGGVPLPRSKARLLWLLSLALVAGLFAWQWFDTRQQLSEMRQQLTQRLSDAEALAKRELEGQRLAQESSEKFNQRLDALEAHLAQSKDNEATLQALYENVAKGREALDLLEVEQAITLAAQQIQIAANVPVALQALRSADAQLARLDKARHLPLRKALAADIHTLNELPLVDVPGISLRLEQIVEAVDKFAFAVYGRPLEDVSSVQPADAADGGDALEMKAWWRLALVDLWHEVRSLIRIQRFDREEPPLLAPGQGFFLRENLKLRLLSARLALFAHDHRTYRSELSLAQHWLTHHFSPEDKAVQAAQLEIKELAAVSIMIDLPDLRASQQALVVLREGKEKR